MKIKIITLLTFIAVTATAQAEFIIKIPMEQSQGGVLPNGSINITPKTPSLPVENWQPADPVYSEWVNEGNVSGCSNWAPTASTMLKDEPFNQTATDCNQYQTRTRQNREQETTTLAYRNVGAPVTMGQNVTVNSSRTATGTAACSFNRNSGLAPPTQWLVNINADNHLLQVNGNVLYNDPGKYSTTLIINGKTYKRGTTVKYSTTGYSYYEVCK